MESLSINTQGGASVSPMMCSLCLSQLNYCKFRAGGELRRGVNPRKDRLKLDNRMTRAMQDVMKLVRVASNRIYLHKT